MIKEETKFVPGNILEGMTSISALLNATGNDRKIEKIWIDTEKRKSKSAEIGFLTARSHALGFPIEFVAAGQIDAVTLGNTHGGIIAFCTERHIPALTAEDIIPNGFYVYMDGIEDPYNFGYALRSLFAAGVNGVVLPERNWMSTAGVVARASAGASERMSLFVADAEAAVHLFHQEGYLALGAGIRDSISVFDSDLRYPILLVIGGEKRGISRKVLDLMDHIVRIDYGSEFHGSLSAASAATVMAFEIMRKNRK